MQSKRPPINYGRQTKRVSFKVEAKGISTNDQGQEVGKIEAYGAIYNNVDEGNDRILPGAFTRTVKNSKARAQSRDNPYIFKMLWNHNQDELIGGWYDIDPNDPKGLRCWGDVLLATQRGREYYELAIAKMADEFSIIYDVIRGEKDNPGARYDEKGVRELLQLRLFTIDPVVLAMNDETYIIGVKSMETKSVCGDTSLPIGPRNESWDGAKAKRQIFDYAAKDDGTIDASKAKKCFLQQDGDGTLKGSWNYPFAYIVDGSPRISVGGVKACAGALAGGRGASTEGEDIAGMRKKVETMYSRINKAYPDDPELNVTWKDDGKMNTQPRQQKTLLEHYNDEMAEDLMEDLQDVYICALIKSIFDAFTIGDQPQSDISQALDDFKELVLSKFVAQAIDCNLSQYLSDNGYSYTPGLSQMLNGSDDGYYGYMSRRKLPSVKRNVAISAANQSNIDDHVAGLHDTADKGMKALKTAMQHMKSIHAAADGFADTMSGGKDDEKEEDKPGKEDGKSLESALTLIKGLRTNR